jgi:flagellar capping protein FliD
MAEINPSTRAAAPTGKTNSPPANATAASPAAQPRGKIPTNREINRIGGLASGMDTNKTIEALVAVERKRLEPTQQQKFQSQMELESFNLVKQELAKIDTSVKSLAGKAIWEGKLVESSDEKIVTATAASGAKPGKYTLIVDKLALNHQIASQGYEKSDTPIGKGKFKITAGEGSPITITIDDSNDSLVGLKDAINFATKEVSATIIKTGNKERPNQLVLTSQKTGNQGRIKLDIDLKGGETPSFENSVEPPSAWKGVGEAKGAGAAGAGGAVGTGASTAIVNVIGDFAGKDDRTFTFNAIQTGEVGGDKPVQLRWKDNKGRSGNIQLDTFNYAPGQPIEFVDGLSLVISKGEVIVGDSFSFQARAARTSLSWWLSPDQRQANVAQPTAWTRQATFGAPVVGGTYTGGTGQNFKLKVEGGGQVGSSRNLKISWQASDGESGAVSVGDGYEPGTQLALTDGITVMVNQGVLTEGQESTFRVTPAEQSGKWWLSEEERKVPAQIADVSNWTTPDGLGPAGQMPELPPELGPRQSSSKVGIAGKYTGDEPKVYTFTALRDGTIGTTKDMRVKWEDDKGNHGELTVGEGYQPTAPLPFDSGLAAAFGPGRVFKDDSFTVRTRTATVQPPQDASIRFGATELGGGLEITSSTNDLDNVIEGVKLNLVSTDAKPVTITIKGDTQKAADSILGFVQQFNEFSTIVTELTKYDKDKNEAGPLQANRDVIDIRNRMTEIMIDPVTGLPKKDNMLFSLGIKLNDKGLLAVDENTLRQKVDENFAAVADMFRERGESSNTSVAFVGMTDKTRVNADGYAVDITQPATQAYYESPDLPDMIVIDDMSNRFQIAVDGRRSEEITLDKKQYGIGEYARALQNKITNDKQVGDRGVRVVADGRRIKVLSGRTGGGSSIAFTAMGDRLQAGVGLMDGQAVPGLDVKGTIDGQPADGTGELLKAKDNENPASGLRLMVKLNPAQINANGPEAKVVVTRGVASKLSQYMSTLVDPLRGEMKRITEGLQARIKNTDEQLTRMEARIDSKRQRIQEKFDRLESQMSKLKSQQSFMSGQLSGLGSGGGGIVNQLLGK